MRTRVLSFGVTEWPYEQTLSDLPACRHDAELVYRQLEALLYERFVSTESSVHINVTAEVALTLFKIVAQAADEDDCTIFYFSGHGKILKDRFSLQFTNSNSYNDGIIIIDELTSIIQKYGSGEFLFVFDCCHSGGAEGLARNFSPYFSSKASLIASGDILHRARANSDVSEFTDVLSRAIDRLARSGTRVTIQSIVTAISENYSSIYTAYRPGIYDIELRPASNKHDPTFRDGFFNALAGSNSTDRASLWYSLADAPETIRRDVLVDRRMSDFREAGWLARRAIGSFIDSFDFFVDEKRHVCANLIGSPNWIDNAVGLIGGRRCLENVELRELYRSHLFSNGLMDTRWLALIYLSDTQELSESDVTTLHSSKFFDTEWGALEVLRICQNEGDFGRTLAEIDSKFDIGPQNRLELKAVAERNGISFTAADLPTTLVSSNNLLSALIGVRQRARTGRTGGEKWLFSKLYGSSRYHYYSSLIFDKIRAARGNILTELRGIEETWDVNLKLSVLDCCKNSQMPIHIVDYFVRVFSNDSHPWVQREVLNLVLARRLENVVSETVQQLMQGLSQIDTTVFPGKLDLVWSIAIMENYKINHGIDFASDVMVQLSTDEQAILTRAMSNESMIVSL